MIGGRHASEASDPLDVGEHAIIVGRDNDRYDGGRGRNQSIHVFDHGSPGDERQRLAR
jgi:hypothetical protein